ncbi:MAG TPA: DegQ family serine endoprotease [Candidatus Sulfotelmatobacter sp.]|nr:DegQ family serine endoprotease [Candidatus Sulfotelmatobacter sp.]
MMSPAVAGAAGRSPARRLRRAAGALAIVLPLVLPTPLIGAAPASARSAPDSFADLAERLLPAVVNVSTTQTIKTASGERGRHGPDIPQFPPGSPFEEFFKDFLERQQHGDRPDAPPRHATSLGSGFIIDPAGYVVTNNHVVADADEITITLHDDSTYKAKLVGRDVKTDLALLKVDSKKPLTAVNWGDSDQTRVGDWVLAIGNPFGLGGSVTAGILSARGRDIQSGAYDDYLQTDASINRGNSGGPMFNTNGDVIGINTAIYSPTGGSVGIGFAIPASLAKPVIDQLKQYGKVRRGWLGVRIQTVTDELAESLGLDKPRGALVSSATENGPAAKAKIEPGDVILKFDGKDINEMRRLPRIVAETPIDKVVDVVVWRKKKEIPLKVQVGELVESDQVAAATPGPGNAPSAPAGSVTELGLQLTAVNPQLREKYGLADDAQGVLVTDVSDTSPAAEKGIKPGDIIVEVGQEEVKTPADVAAKIKAARDAKRKSVLLLVDQKGDLRFVAVRIDS